MTTDAQDGRVELLAPCFSPDGFRHFCGLLEIQPKQGGGRIRFKLSPLQRTFCNQRSGRDIVLKPRQVFMTTLECARDIWVFLTRPGARVVIVCQSQTDQGPFKDIAYKFRLFFDSLQRSGLRLDLGVNSIGEWSLPQRDATLRIIQAGASEASAAKKGRGGTINRLHFTEAAFFEHADTTFNALLESVPGPETGSEIVNESTANGVGGFYYEQWQSAVRGVSGYKAHFFKWWDHPEYFLPLEPGEEVRPDSELEEKLLRLGVTSPQLKWYRRKLAEKGKDMTAQEYPSDPESCFLVSGRHFFDNEVTTALMNVAKAPALTEDRGHVRVWTQPVPGAHYVVSVDTSEGISPDNRADSSDCTAAAVFRRNGEHVATLHGRWPTWEAARKVATLGRAFNNAMIAVERNNHGHAVIQGLMREQMYQNLYLHDDERPGWVTSAVTRPMMLDQLEDAHRRGVFKSNDERLLGEMRTFVVGQNGKPQASSGAHDDLVMAAAIGWAVICRPMGAARNLANLPAR